MIWAGWAGSKGNQSTTLEDLKRDLLKMYWSNTVQKRVLSQLLRPGMYSPGRRSMTHHAWYWLKKYAAEMDFVEDKIKFQYNEEILNLPRIRNNEEEDGQELTRPQFAIEASQEHNDIIATQTDQDILKCRPQFAIEASQEHNDIIATQTDQDILKCRWERMQHKHKEKRLQDGADKEFEEWLEKLTEIQPVTSIKKEFRGVHYPERRYICMNIPWQEDPVEQTILDYGDIFSNKPGKCKDVLLSSRLRRVSVWRQEKSKRGVL
ncbi:hypothetical protein QE152_g3801 [Popillia japonica]|uniref:Uncharacterized protein n=1 Tax=Popillia japonica TaxID=7064 RepID=A0AAW1MZ90_POPJA